MNYPIKIYVFFNTLSAFIALVYFAFFPKTINLFNFEDGMLNFYWLIFLHAYATFLVYIGYKLATYPFTKLLLNNTVYLPTNTGFIHNSQLKPSNLLSLLILFFSFVILYYSYQGNGLFIREGYLSDSPKFITAVSLLISIAALAIIVLTRINGQKLRSFFYFLIFIIPYFGTGSRKIILFLFIYLFLDFIYTQKHKKFYKAIAYIVIILFISAWILGHRSLEQHGLIPYTLSLFDISIFENSLNQIAFIINYIFIYGYTVTSEVLYDASFYQNLIPFEIFLFSINPLPSSVIGDWESLSRELRVNLYVPYNLYGEVFAQGWFISTLFFMLLGSVLGVFGLLLKTTFKNNIVIQAIVLLLVLVFTVTATQYNLRSSVRLIYYAGFILFMSWLLINLKNTYFALKKNS